MPTPLVIYVKNTDSAFTWIQKRPTFALLLFKLRQDPFESTDEESGMYVEWMGQKTWAFGPAKPLVEQHLATFKDWSAPPKGAAPTERRDGGLGQ